jgi:hypothetical protein
MNPTTAPHLITDDELVEASCQALRKAGLDSRIHAAYLSSLCKEVVGSDDPLLVQVQPTILLPLSRCWSKGYAIVLQFLSDFNLAYTTSAAIAEATAAGIQFRHPFPDAAGIDFDQLIATLPPKLKVKERVRKANPEPTGQKKRTPKHTPHARGAGLSTPRSGTPKSDARRAGAVTPRIGTSDSDVIIDEVIRPRVK